MVLEADVATVAAQAAALGAGGYIITAAGSAGTGRHAQVGTWLASTTALPSVTALSAARTVDALEQATRSSPWPATAPTTGTPWSAGALGSIAGSRGGQRGPETWGLGENRKRAQSAQRKGRATRRAGGEFRGFAAKGGGGNAPC